jgi:hypothetical protein
VQAAMLTRRGFVLAVAAPAAAAAGLGITHGGLAGETYPTRPIKLVVPFPPGTPSEFVIRDHSGSPVVKTRASHRH